MVVLQLGPYPPPHGGVQTHLVAIRQHLRAREIAAPVINLTRHRASDSDGVYYPRTPFEVVKLLLAIPADIIHLHIGGHLAARLLALCLFCSLLPGRRVVLTFHSGGYPTWGGRGARHFSARGFILRRLDAIIAVNSEIVSLFRRLGVSEDRIKLICPYAPVSLPENVILPEHLDSFRRSHHPLLTTVGLLEPEYDLALQIRGLAAVRRKFPEAGLVIIGSGSLEPQLRRLIASAPEGAHVLLCGDVPHPVTLRVLSETDVFLRTTLYDGDSVSVREALELGIPVVVTDNGMRPAGVHLIPRSNAGALVAAIETAIHAPCREPASTRGNAQQLDEILDLYASLLGRRITIPSISAS